MIIPNAESRWWDTGSRLKLDQVKFHHDRGTPLQHSRKVYRLIISTGSGDIMEFNGSIPRVLYKSKILQRKIWEMFLVILHVARETGAFLHQVIANDQRVLQRWGLAKQSVVSADNCHQEEVYQQVQGSRSPVPLTSVYTEFLEPFVTQVSSERPSVCSSLKIAFPNLNQRQQRKTVLSLAPGPFINEKSCSYLWLS